MYMEIQFDKYVIGDPNFNILLLFQALIRPQLHSAQYHTYISPLYIENIPYRHSTIPNKIHHLPHRDNNGESEFLQYALLLFQHPLTLFWIIRLTAKRYSSKR